MCFQALMASSSHPQKIHKRAHKARGKRLTGHGSGMEKMLRIMAPCTPTTADSLAKDRLLHADTWEEDATMVPTAPPIECLFFVFVFWG